MFERNLPKLYPGSKYGVRYPIGLMSVVDNFKRKELVDYYHKWYHPDHQGIIVVGDVDVNHTEAQIKKLFGSIKNPANEAKLVDEPVPDNAEPIIIIDKDKEYPTSSVDLMIKHDVFPDSLKQTLPYLIQNYAKQAVSGMLAQRFTEAAQKADCPFVGAEAGDGNYIFAKTKDAFDISASPKDMSKTADALKAAYLVVRQAAEFGFTPTEYERFKSNYLSGLDKMYSNKDKRTNTSFYQQCLGYFLNNEPMPSIDYTYTMMKQLVPAIPLEAINQVLPELITKSDSNLVIINFNNEKEGAVYPTAEQLHLHFVIFDLVRLYSHRRSEIDDQTFRIQITLRLAACLHRIFIDFAGRRQSEIKCLLHTRLYHDGRGHSAPHTVVSRCKGK